MIEAVLLVKPPQTWIQTIASKYPATIRVLDCKALQGKEGVEELFEITVDEQHSDNLINDLRQDSYVSEVNLIGSKAGRITGSVKTNKCTACRSFAISDCFLISVSSKKEGYVEWVVLGSDDAFRNLLKSLEKQGVEVTLKRRAIAKTEEDLTPRQKEIIQIALEKGYFDYPKGIDLRSLGSLLDVSPSTLTELLRKAQKKILREYFRGRISTMSRQQRVQP